MVSADRGPRKRSLCKTVLCPPNPLQNGHSSTLRRKFLDKIVPSRYEFDKRSFF